jgi:antitoxin ParD1/3/4
MTEEVHVVFGGELQRFLLSRIGEGGLYSSTDEYIRDLVRKDYDREEGKSWEFLRQELMPGMEAREHEFVPLNLADILQEARTRKHAHEG